MAEPGDGTPKEPGSEGATGPTGPIRKRAATLVGEGGPIRRFLSRWGFPLFVLLVAYIGRSVLLPFVFAALIAYILAPLVRRMSERDDGTRRMPRPLAILTCYIVFIAGIVGFLFVLVPRLSSDIQRIGAEAPKLYKKVNEKYVPELARWIEWKIPSLTTRKVEQEASPIVADVPLPPGTAFTVTPLPDGRLAVQLAQGGIDVTPVRGGGFHLISNETPPEPQTLEEKLRAYVDRAMTSLQSKANDVVRFGQRLVTGMIRGVIVFFITLMMAGFILMDMEKVHTFLRSLFPPNVRDDYDVIMAGIDQGLSGVIRGQLLICLVNGLLTYVGLVIFQVKYSLILAFIAALMSLIPIFGSILSTFPIVVAALVSGESGLDVFRAVVMTLWIVGIHFLEANFLNPKIIGAATKIHPVLVIFALFFGEATYGLVGALLAVPVLSTVQVLFLFFYRKRWLEPSAPRLRRPTGITGPPPMAPPAAPPPASPPPAAPAT